MTARGPTMHRGHDGEGLGGSSPAGPRLGVAKVGFALLLCAACLLAALLYVGAERTFYYWDTVGYWVRSVEYAEALQAHPLAAWKELGRSVSHDELSLLPAALPAAWMLAFGTSRAAYVSALVTLYAVPGLLLLFVVLEGLALGRPGRWGAVGAGAAAVLLLAPVWGSVLHGQVGVAGFAPAVTALLFILRRRPQEWHVWEGLVIAALLVLLFLIRRWWAFWSLTAAAGIGVEAAWVLLRRNGRPWEERFRAMGGPAAVLLFTPVLGALLAAPRIARIFSSGYTSTFRPYRSGAGAGHILHVIHSYWGALPVIALLWAAAVGVIRNRGRVTTLLAYLTFVPPAFLFAVQDPSPHHWMLVAPAGAVLLGLALQAASHRRPTLVLATAAGLAVLIATFVPQGRILRTWMGPLAPSQAQQPEVRGDIAEVARLLSFLDGRLNGVRGTVYVLSASGVLCGDTLRYANLSEGWSFITPGRVLPTAVVDARDGFPVWLILASYVVTTDPLQLSLPPSAQDVVRVPWRLIMAGRGFGAAFRRIPGTFMLENGVRAVVFQRFRASTPPEIQDLRRIFVRSEGPLPHFFDRLDDLEEYLESH